MSWLKMEACTPEKAEVLAITARMGWDDADLTVGKLFRMWRWFDQQTTNGNAAGVTTALLDRIVGVSGFCEAMQSVGWLEITESGVSLPNFERHNGSTAKGRALTAKRVANHKANAGTNDSGNAESVSGALPREEKRREEKKSSSLRSEESAPAKRERVSVIVAETLPLPTTLDRETWRDWVSYRSSIRKPLKVETAEKQIQFLCESIASGHDPVAIINDSIRNGWTGLFAKDHHKTAAKPQAESFYEREQAAKRKRWEEMTGRPWPTDGSTVIDVTPTTKEISHEPAYQSR